MSRAAWRKVCVWLSCAAVCYDGTHARYSLFNTPTVLGGELRVRSDEQDGVVLTALIPVTLCDSAGGALPSSNAAKVFPRSRGSSSDEAAGPHARPAAPPEDQEPGGSASSPVPPEEDTGFAPYLPPEDSWPAYLAEPHPSSQPLELLDLVSSGGR